MYHELDGAKGPRGEDGETGPKGYSGYDGQMGPTGYPGDIGDSGKPLKGFQGQKGTKGPEGDQGVLGDPGVQGTSFGHIDYNTAYKVCFQIIYLWNYFSFSETGQKGDIRQLVWQVQSAFAEKIHGNSQRANENSLLMQVCQTLYNLCFHFCSWDWPSSRVLILRVSRKSLLLPVTIVSRG